MGTKLALALWVGTNILSRRVHEVVLSSTMTFALLSTKSQNSSLIPPRSVDSNGDPTGLSLLQAAMITSSQSGTCGHSVLPNLRRRITVLLSRH